MNLPIKSLATAVTLALASVSAHAALTPPAQNLTSPPVDSSGAYTGLYLAVYNGAGTQSEVVNLGYAYSQISAASGNLNPTAPNAAFVQAAAPTGSGNVLQLNFGQISGFSGSSSIFNSSNLATDGYMVLSAVTGGPGVEQLSATYNGTPPLAYGGVNTVGQAIQSEIANWVTAAPTTGDLSDTTGTATYSVQKGIAFGGLNDGQIISGTNYSGSVGSALGFYNVTTTALHKDAITQYGTSAGTGYWFLSNSGMLTYNVPVAGTAPVPLPAAVWLLGSGLLGMTGIARRRRGAA